MRSALSRAARYLAPCFVCLLTGTASASVTPEQMEGVYVFKDAANQKELHLAYVGKGKLKVSFNLKSSAKPPAIGVGGGDATVSGDVATYAKSGACSIAMRFEPGNRLGVTQTGSDADCGFGSHLTADGEYTKSRGGNPSVAVVPQDAPPPVHTPADLRATAGRAQKEAAGAKAHIEEKRPRIDDLAAARKKALAEVQSKKTDFEKHARAANTGFKKWQAAAAKANAKPSAAELATAADKEHEQALSLGKELLDARAALRTVEDELAQVVADASQAATDADADVKDIRDASTAAGKLKPDAAVQGSADDLAKLKTELRTALTQTQAAARAAHSAATTVVGRAHFTAKGYGTKRDKDVKDDGTLKDRVAALQKQRDAMKATG
jgi:hypothetical protein